MPEKSRQKTFTPKFIALLVLLLVLGLGAAAGVWYWQISQVPASVALPVHTEKKDPMAGWKTYTDTQYGFEIKYPADWKTELSQTVYTFSDPASGLNQNCSVSLTFGGSVSPKNDKINNYNEISEGQKCDQTLNQILSTFKFITPAAGPDTVVCGVLTGIKCPTTGYTCKSAGSSPDAPTVCTKQTDNSPISVPAPTPNPNKPISCAQVITTARNPQTGEVRDFPTPCDVPPGWEKVGGSVN